MADATYVIQPWEGLDLYTCLVPEAGGMAHGWQAFSLDRMTDHLAQIHGAEAIEEVPE